MEADFAGHRRAIIQFFAALAVLSLFFSRGFLGVRGLAILELLWANYALREFAGHFSWPFLLIKLGIYGIVVVAMYLAIAPERLRDWLVGPFLQKVKKK
ncbi:MAG: hypothetical protein LBI69_03230 [Puniceicoccales bacterium]|nr:hypothetical protein [Puniceicoccales bacterium]